MTKTDIKTVVLTLVYAYTYKTAKKFA